MNRTRIAVIYLIILLGGLFFAKVSLAATYYVATNGNDANPGTQSQPWARCPGMTSWSGSARLNPGDTVYFDRAGVWSVTGTQGIYLFGGVTYIGDSWGSGTRATIKASSNLDAGVIRFRDHSTSPTIFKGFDVDANHTVSTGIDINHGYWSLMNGATKRVENVEVHNVSSRVANGEYKYGIIVSNHGGTGGYAENVEIINAKVHDVSRDAICLYPGDENASCRIKNITVRGCEAYNTGQDPDYCCGAGIIVKGYVQDAIVENNYVHGTKGAGIFVNGNETNHFGVGPVNIHFRYNIVSVNNSNGAIRIYDGSSGADPKDIKIYGNVVYNSTANGGFLIDRDLGNTNKLLVYNNTFYNAPVIVNNSNATFSPFEFKNNIVYYPSGTPITGSSHFTSSSNNLTTNPSFRSISNLPTGFTGTYGADLAPNADGLSLQPGSPGINAGIALAADYEGSVNSLARPQGAGWDIGAYEYSDGGPPSDTTAPARPSGLRVR